MGTKDIQPSVLSYPFSKGPENLRVPENLLEKGRIPTILKATEILAARNGNGKRSEIPLIAGMEGPLTVFTHLAEVKNCLIWALKKSPTILICSWKPVLNSVLSMQTRFLNAVQMPLYARRWNSRLKNDAPFSP